MFSMKATQIWLIVNFSLLFSYAIIKSEVKQAVSEGQFITY